MVSNILKCEQETAASQGRHSGPRRLQGRAGRKQAGRSGGRWMGMARCTGRLSAVLNRC